MLPVNGKKQSVVGYSAVILRDGNIFISGGVTLPDQEALSSTWFFNPKSSKVTLGPSMDNARYYHAAALLDDGKVLLTGGRDDGPDNDPEDHLANRLADPLNSCQLYDPATKKFSAVGQMHISRYGHAVLPVRHNKALLVCGKTMPNMADDEYNQTRTMELLDLTTKKSEIMAEVCIPRDPPQAIIVKGNRAVVFGGFTEKASPIKTAEIFNLNQLDN